jgi:hypothetical protein
MVVSPRSSAMDISEAELRGYFDAIAAQKLEYELSLSGLVLP